MEKNNYTVFIPTHAFDTDSGEWEEVSIENEWDEKDININWLEDSEFIHELEFIGKISKEIILTHHYAYNEDADTYEDINNVYKGLLK